MHIIRIYSKEGGMLVQFRNTPENLKHYRDAYPEGKFLWLW